MRNRRDGPAQLYACFGYTTLTKSSGGWRSCTESHIFFLFFSLQVDRLKLDELELQVATLSGENHKLQRSLELVQVCPR